jgi:hypothetical protein
VSESIPPNNAKSSSVAKARITLGALVALVIALVAVAPATARPDPAGVVVEGLSDPRGIAVAGGRTLLVAYSSSGKIVRLDPRRGGKKVAVSTFAEFPFDPEAGPSPVEVVYQSLNHVWVTLAGDPAAGGGRVVRLDRKGNETVTVESPATSRPTPMPTTRTTSPRSRTRSGSRSRPAEASSWPTRRATTS